jgi:nicotinate-nucleotide adenylyltransferase
VRIAVLGGTFDPIHNGHIAAAQSVSAAFQVQEVHFVPSFSPPHKQDRDLSSPFHRFAMVCLATMPFIDFRPSTIEVDALEKRYTVETLELMGRQYPEAQILFVLGTDMYQEIETWKDYRRLFNLAHLVIVNRPGFPFREDVWPFQVLAAEKPFADTHPLSDHKAVSYLPFVEQPVSSTEIRDKCRRGEEIHQWVPDSVRRYIEKNKLYS